MSIRVPSLTVASLLASLTLAAPAGAKPPRAKAKAKPARATQLERRVIKVGRTHIEPISLPHSGPGGVAPHDPVETAFTLSANTPHVPYRGHLLGSYPREWRSEGNNLGPGGEVWLSQNQVPHLSYATAELEVEAGHDYEVTLCTTSGDWSEMVRATVGDTTHTFKAGNRDCDVTLVLQPEKSGKISIKIDFADEPREHASNAFALLGVEVVRRKH